MKPLEWVRVPSAVKGMFLVGTRARGYTFIVTHDALHPDLGFNISWSRAFDKKHRPEKLGTATSWADAYRQVEAWLKER